MGWSLVMKDFLEFDMGRDLENIDMFMMKKKKVERK